MIIPVDESILVSDWDNIKFRPKRTADNAVLTGRLFKKETRIRDIYDNLLIEHGKGNITKEMFQKALFGGTKNKKETKEKRKRIKIADFFQKVIDDSSSGARRSLTKLRLKSDSIKPYSSCLSGYREFEEYMDSSFYLDQIDQDFIENFEDYLFNIKGLSLNTKSTYLKKFRLVINYAIEKKLISSNNISFRGLLGREDSDAIYLDDTNLKEMMDIQDFTSDIERVVRDLFVLACRQGLRFSDFSRITPAMIQNGNLNLIQIKTMEKLNVPLHPEAIEILKRYPNGFKDMCPKNQPFNDYLKIIASKVPSLNVPFEKRITKAGKTQPETLIKKDLLVSHTARRTFCTLSLLKGIEIPVIMANSGHKDVKTFLSYVKVSSDILAQKIKKHW
jgi:integrase